MSVVAVAAVGAVLHTRRSPLARVYHYRVAAGAIALLGLTYLFWCRPSDWSIAGMRCFERLASPNARDAGYGLFRERTSMMFV